MKEALVVGLCGGSASGKTTLAKRIIEELNVQWVSLLSMDSFYKELNEDEIEKAHKNDYDFDHPDAYDFDLLIQTLKELKGGKQVHIPIYNFNTHSREPMTKTVYGANVIIFEGIMAFINKDLRDLIDIKIFVDTDADIRLARRLKRDICERGRNISSVIAQYNRFVKPSFEYQIAPTMAYADIIVPRGGDNSIALDLIVKHVHRELNIRDSKLRLGLALKANENVGQALPSSVHKIEQTKQIRFMHTIIRNKDTAKDEFIFYSNRLMRVLFEHALSLLPFDQVKVKTTGNQEYEGKRHANDRVCGVSIMRAGECLEPALCEVFKNAVIGKILIQTNELTGEPELHYLRLPSDIKNMIVLLMDAAMATGAAAMMAIRILLDHSVEEKNIILVSILMAEQGIRNLTYAFPKIRIVTTAVDSLLDQNGHMIPGFGNFGDRYFGT